MKAVLDAFIAAYPWLLLIGVGSAVLAMVEIICVLKDIRDDLDSVKYLAERTRYDSGLSPLAPLMRRKS